MQAVVMAGGEGTRLRPLTTNRPKPVVLIVNRPMLEHTINLLTQHGFKYVVQFLDDNWILMHPSSEESVINLYAEASSKEGANRLIDEYVERIHALAT